MFLLIQILDIQLLSLKTAILAGIHLEKSPRGGQKQVRRHFGGGGGGGARTVGSIQF